MSAWILVALAPYSTLAASRHCCRNPRPALPERAVAHHAAAARRGACAIRRSGRRGLSRLVAGSRSASVAPPRSTHPGLEERLRVRRCDRSWLFSPCDDAGLAGRPLEILAPLHTSFS